LKNDYAYLDTSAFLALVFRQSGYKQIEKILENVEQVLTTDLLMSEATSVFVRERGDFEVLKTSLGGLLFITAELSVPLLESVLRAGWLRGADLYHLAAAFWLTDSKPKNIYFLTLDEQQNRVAGKLGFKTMTIK
jgi:predicted nucleic acid-binding protein